MKQYIITIYEHPLKTPEPPQGQKSPLTLFDTEDRQTAVNYFICSAYNLDNGAVQLWQNGRQVGYLYL